MKRKHKISFLLCITAVMLVLIARLSYKEDISDFLPLGTEDREALSVYQDISGSNRLFVIFQSRGTTGKDNNEDTTVSAIDHFCADVAKRDTAGWIADMTSQIDMQKMLDVSDFIYQNIPYFLMPSDYHRMDSLLSIPGYIDRQIQSDHENLMLPSAGILAFSISRDPLGLFTPTVQSRLSTFNSQHSTFNSHFATYNSYIFTPDMSRAIVMLSSPFGNSETEQNSKLIALLQASIDNMEASYPTIKAHIVGGPQIAVGNAQQIKQDSIIAVSIASVLILLLLTYSIRSAHNILLIAISIAWGWLFALAGLSLFHDSVSLIVIGISSVILGIAVNYPLHLVVHLGHTGNTKQALKEIIAPLVVGNITTVGAFAALIPLHSIALRDLGLFAALLLIGTIVFVIIFLPDMVKTGAGLAFASHADLRFKFLASKRSFLTPHSSLFINIIILITLVLGYFSLSTEFDSNMANINYMTEEQRSDLAYFQRLLSPDSTSNTKTVYIVSTANTPDKALTIANDRQVLIDSLCTDLSISYHSSATDFLCSRSEQHQRLALWHDFISRHAHDFSTSLATATKRYGFSDHAFSAFHHIIGDSYSPQPLRHFQPLTKTILASSVSIDSIAGRYSIVDRLQVNDEQQSTLDTKLNTFNIKLLDGESVNRALADSLSDDFNYIGWACSAIVFLFLWFSMGRIEMALISFIPMAMSWIWILGIMALLGIKFNIVNIILATFIFGQGDDYTIFMTEGCQYEYAHRRPMLASYRNGIILSALIMFIGIGSLIVARHPALHSLAEVTIIGMFSVVLMSWMIPPILFWWITKQHRHYRRRPLTIGALARTWVASIWWLSQLLCGYIIGFILFVILKPTPSSKALFHRIVTACHRFNQRIFPGVKFELSNPHGEDFSSPCVIACNHQSMLDPICLMTLSPKIIIVANKRASFNPVIRIMFRWLDFYTVTEDKFMHDMPHFRKLINEGYSIAIFPEGERNPLSKVLRFHKGVFYLATQLHLDILPIYIHGMNEVMPIGSFAINKNTVSVFVGERITSSSELWTDDHAELTRRVHRFYTEQYNIIKREKETAAYYSQLVYQRYLYKGFEIQRTVQRNLKRYNNYSAEIDVPSPVCCCATATTPSPTPFGYGEKALLMALVHPDKTIYAWDDDKQKRNILYHAARGLVTNLIIEPPRNNEIT